MTRAGHIVGLVTTGLPDRDGVSALVMLPVAALVRPFHRSGRTRAGRIGCILMAAILAGCASTPPLPEYPDFAKTKPTVGTLVVLADATSLHYMSGGIDKLDVPESQQFGALMLSTMEDELRQKGYRVGRTVLVSSGFVLRPGTRVYVIRTPDDRGRDPLPTAETPIYLDQKLAQNPTLTQAWEALRAPQGTPYAALSVLRETFGADNVILVFLVGRNVPFGVTLGRSMLSALTLGTTSWPSTRAGIFMHIVDTRTGRLHWEDEWAKEVSLSEVMVRGLAEIIVRRLP